MRCAALACAGLVALVFVEPVGAFDIVEDYGGTLAVYRDEARRLEASGEELAIRGVCASACTIFLGLRKVCVEPGAMFWFHAARLPGGAAPDPLATLEMLSLYPRRLRDWAIRAHALERLDFDEAASLTGAELIRMGARRCPRTVPRSRQ
ncbi:MULTISPECIES: hypothetical protein [Methylosinus]|uniref:Uncharacterized protein n=1 Tax=Methylosinus trichosporium (strain ATCC 35070 / NCIMB 11131 / UNIQEM 75 / OB3b) TaxID=595536 RepID=A0A2D2CVW0_METT3|nr:MULTISPECIES: hypothetical protein [Methylosinus]ATQ66918.1 hypothetical protein CQW49_02690 [Methylosinus trichosporium OB3b]OBS54120.1 hypothetical protein A8B73_02455 [Methylosinus sp. 3S-1]